MMHDKFTIFMKEVDDEQKRVKNFETLSENFGMDLFSSHLKKDGSVFPIMEYDSFTNLVYGEEHCRFAATFLEYWIKRNMPCIIC